MGTLGSDSGLGLTTKPSSYGYFFCYLVNILLALQTKAKWMLRMHIDEFKGKVVKIATALGCRDSSVKCRHLYHTSTNNRH